MSIENSDLFRRVKEYREHEKMFGPVRAKKDEEEKVNDTTAKEEITNEVVLYIESLNTKGELNNS